MNGQAFDTLVRATSEATEATSRRGVLGLLFGGAVAAALACIEPALGRKKGKGKGKNKKKKCRKLNQGCGGKKKKCCKGLTCTNGVCIQPAPPAECESDNDCDSDEICQNGECVPEPPECDSDNDCGDNEECQNGTCVCPEIEDGRCIRRCETQDDCPGTSSCRNLSPEDAPSIEDGVCIDEAFFPCDVAACTENDDCDNDEVCVMLGCGVGTPQVGRCHPFSVF